MKINVLVSAITVGVYLLGTATSYNSSASMTSGIPNRLEDVSEIEISTPEQTIEQYVLLSRANKVSEIRGVITTLPDTYIKQTYLNASNSPDARQSSVRENNGETTYLSGEIEIREFRKSFEPLIYRFLTEFYPKDIRTTDVTFDKVVKKKVKLDDAYLQVNLRSNKNRAYDRELLFFLHREAQVWKIFYITDLVSPDYFRKEP